MDGRVCEADGCGVSLEGRHALTRFCSRRCTQGTYLPTWRAENVEQVRASRRAYERKYRFGVTEDDYDAQMEIQNGACAICGGHTPDRRLAIDHDHKCCAGKRTCGSCKRGLLCSNCNTTLGKMKDDPALLRRAAEYLEQGGVWG